MQSYDFSGLTDYLVLLEVPHRASQRNSVLLTIDLTKAVADEAIRRKDSIIITYRKFVCPLNRFRIATKSSYRF